MYIENLKDDFYNLLLGNRILLLVHYDVDAVCAFRILQDLFKCDNISYTLLSVSTTSDLKSAFDENKEDLKYVILINCGGTLDLVEFLQPDDSVVFFVLDSHRPTDLCNVYYDSQVRLLWKENDENIPAYDEIFKDNDESEASDSEGDEHSGEENGEEEGRAEGRLRRAEASIRRRKERQAWDENRDRLIFDYTQFTYFSKPSTFVCLELAALYGRSTSASAATTLWSTGIALSYQQILYLRPPNTALLDLADLQPHVASFNNQHNQGITIAMEQDLSLPLFRACGVEAGLRNNPEVMAKLRLSDPRGDSNLRKLLAEIGLPLTMAQWPWWSVSSTIRLAARQALQEAAAPRSLSLLAHCMLMKRPPARPKASLDAAYHLLALLDRDFESKSLSIETPLKSLDLSSLNSEGDGEKAAKQLLATVYAASTMAVKTVQCAGPFFYVHIDWGKGARCVGPMTLLLTAQRVSLCLAERHSGSLSDLPLVASAPHPLQPEHRCLLLGLPPRFRENTRNLFGKAFEQAALSGNCDMRPHYFDSSFIDLRLADRNKFLDALTALLS